MHITPVMIAAGAKAIDDYYSGTKDAPFEGSVEACYRAMRALEPPAPVTHGLQICGACGKPWNGQLCGQKDNGWDFPTCYPADGNEQQGTAKTEE